MDIRVLHLFHAYLPHTMNWAYRAMRAVPGVHPWAAAPWVVRNTYYVPEVRVFARPLQQRLGWWPGDEWQYEAFWQTLVRLERYWPVYQRWLFKQLKDDPPDVLHAHFGPIGCQYLPLAEQLGRPLVCSFYGYDYESVPFQKPAYRALYQHLFEKAALITALGPCGRAALESQGCPPEKIAVVYMGIDPEAFPFALRKKRPGTLHLLQVATFNAKKGHLDTLEALRQLRDRCPSLRLTLAGEQEDVKLVAAIRAFIRQHHLEDRVQWLDFVSHKDLPKLMAEADLFVHPSKYTPQRNSEGMPAVILEAQATGLPVVSTLHFDIPTAVRHGETGLLSPENDPIALAQHLERFYWMDNPEYQNFSHAAHTHAAQFDVRLNGAVWAGLYALVRGE